MISLHFIIPLSPFAIVIPECQTSHARIQGHHPDTVVSKKTLVLPLRSLGSRFWLCLAADLQLADRLRLGLRRRHCHLQHPVMERRLRIINVHALGQRHSPMEFSVASLGTIETFVLLFALRSPLAFNSDRVVGQLDFYIVF